MDRTVAHDKALEIIKEHGWDSPTQPTAWSSKQGWIEGTSFYDEMGNKQEYSRVEIARWLGY